MYCVQRGVAECSRTVVGESCTVMDCSRFTAGELVGNAPHRPMSPNMLPKQLLRGAPLHTRSDRLLFMAVLDRGGLMKMSPKKVECIIAFCALATYGVLLYHTDILCHLQMVCGVRGLT